MKRTTSITGLLLLIGINSSEVFASESSLTTVSIFREQGGHMREYSWKLYSDKLLHPMGSWKNYRTGTCERSDRLTSGTLYPPLTLQQMSRLLEEIIEEPGISVPEALGNTLKQKVDTATSQWIYRSGQQPPMSCAASSGPFSTAPTNSFFSYTPVAVPPTADSAAPPPATYVSYTPAPAAVSPTVDPVSMTPGSAILAIPSIQQFTPVTVLLTPPLSIGSIPCLSPNSLVCPSLPSGISPVLSGSKLTPPLFLSQPQPTSMVGAQLATLPADFSGVPSSPTQWSIASPCFGADPKESTLFSSAQIKREPPAEDTSSCVSFLSVALGNSCPITSQPTPEAEYTANENSEKKFEETEKIESPVVEKSSASSNPSELKELREENERLKKQDEKRKQEVVELQNSAHDKNEQIKQLNKKNAELQAKICRLERQLSEQQRQSKEQRNQLRENQRTMRQVSMSSRPKPKAKSRSKKSSTPPSPPPSRATPSIDDLD